MALLETSSFEPSYSQNIRNWWDMVSTLYHPCEPGGPRAQLTADPAGIYYLTVLQDPMGPGDSIRSGSIAADLSRVEVVQLSYFCVGPRCLSNLPNNAARDSPSDLLARVLQPGVWPVLCGVKTNI